MTYFVAMPFVCGEDGRLGAGEAVERPASCGTRKAADGEPLVRGKNVTGFTDSEEEAVGLTKVVPFLVEDDLKRNGGNFSRGADWAPYVVSDGLLITGQNPASSAPAAKLLLNRLDV